MKERTNLGASVSTRLLNQARQSGADYQTLLTSYCLERFLYRLGASNLRDRFVLKGAMLLRLWADQPYRATRDLDLLRRGDGEFNAVRADLRAILAAPAPPDAVSFDANKIEVRNAVEQMFNVTVERVNTMVMPGKPKSRSTKTAVVRGTKSSYKKAYVTLTPGETIDIFGGNEE